MQWSPDLLIVIATTLQPALPNSSEELQGRKARYSYNKGKSLFARFCLLSTNLFVGEFQWCGQFSDLLWAEVLLALKSAVQDLELLLRESCTCFDLFAPWTILLGSLRCRSQLWRKRKPVGAGGRVRCVKSEHSRTGRLWREIYNIIKEI